jgi:tetratricopeptide (TPR) repeat protein
MNAPLVDRRGRAYTPAVSPRLKLLLAVIFAVVALLGANSVYLVAITILGEEYQNQFYMLMFLMHLALGLLLLLPFLVFALGHLATAYNRPNRRAVRAGIALLTVSVILIVSGFVLMRLDFAVPFGASNFKFEVKDPTARSVAYWAHVISPLVAIGFYITHRMAGPIIKWRWAWAWAGAVGAFVLAMSVFHHQDPRQWGSVGPKEGATYFAPSSARTVTGNFIPANVLLMDDYCQKCHPDAYEQHYKSVHHFSSFNNKPYLFSVNETREVSLKRDGTVQASRWCAGCHDPVPFFSGQFDDPKYDIKNKSDPTTQAGITCTVCHAITNVNSVTGNADYTIDEPMHYPFATSTNEVLQWINNQLVKAKPALHKKTFLKPFHRSEEFCSTCHKVSIPFALNHYKEFLRGQNHYDPFLLSGQSGHGARSFYYPDKAKDRCADCHMPLANSNDFGAQDFDKSGTRKMHSHFFPGANTGLPFLRNYEMLMSAQRSGKSESEVTESAEYRWNEGIIKAHQDFLRDGQMRVDIFALRHGGTIEGELVAPLRPEVPKLKPGGKYLVEVVLRTIKLGHLFTQGTIDSNEVWVDFEARAGGRIIGRNGAMDREGNVDPWSHFVNALVIDRSGNRIDRRNPQDIYVPVYNHQIPPGAGQVVHYLLQVPDGITDPIQLTAKLQYRKFDRKYMEHVFRDDKVPVPNLPITTLCEDSITLAMEGSDTPVENAVVKIPEWQRWNDYGIGLFLEGEQSSGSEKGELRQAEEVFKKVVELGQGEGYANLARIYVREKRLADAVNALAAAGQNTDMLPFATAGAGPGQLPGAAQQYVKPAAPWVIAWVTGLVNKENGQLDDAIRNFELILSDEMYQAVRDRAFDFRLDYVVWNELGIVRFERAEQERGAARAAERQRRLREAVDAFEHTLAIDPEDLTAHFNLALLYGILASDANDAARSNTADDLPASEGITASSLRELAEEVTGSSKTGAKGQPVQAAAKLARAIPGFLKAKRDPFESRLVTLVDILPPMRTAYRERASREPEFGNAVASVLNVLHRELHLMYKIDDNARESVAIHRRNNPAANHAAQSIVIYPLNRDGAPGLADSQRPAGDPGNSTAAESADSTSTALRE